MARVGGRTWPPDARERSFCAESSAARNTLARAPDMGDIGTRARKMGKRSVKAQALTCEKLVLQPKVQETD